MFNLISLFILMVIMYLGYLLVSLGSIALVFTLLLAWYGETSWGWCFAPLSVIVLGMWYKEKFNKNDDDDNNTSLNQIT
jgi:hypothetical protein